MSTLRKVPAMSTNSLRHKAPLMTLRLMLIGLAAIAASVCGIAMLSTPAQAADPYAHLKAADFKWEKWWEKDGRQVPQPMADGVRQYLEQQGIRCEGSVCRPSGERPIPDVLDLSGRDLRNVTFKDLVVNNIKTNATNLSNSRFENLQLNGKWEARELLAKKMAITGAGSGSGQPPTARFEADWKLSNVEGMTLAHVNVGALSMADVKARWSHVSESAINHEAMHALLKGGVVQFPSNVITETHHHHEAGVEGPRGLLPEGRYEGLNLDGSRLEGSLRNVEFVNCNLTAIEAHLTDRPEGAYWTKAWENVSVKGGFISDAKLNLHSSDRITLAALEQDNVSLTTRENTSNFRMQGRAMALRLIGNYEHTDLADLKPEFTANENYAHLPHIVDHNQLREAPTDKAFLDLSNSRQVNFEAPRNISNSKFNNTEFVNTTLPEKLRAHNIQAHGLKFESSEANSNKIGKDADFRGADFNAASFNGQRMQSASFNDATLTDVKFEGVTLEGSTTFDRAKVSGLNANNSEISNGAKLSAIGTIWNKILKFFGFEPQARSALEGSRFEGLIDFSNTPGSVLAGMNWRGVTFEPGSELVFRDTAATLEAMGKVMQSHSTNTVKNLSVSFLDDNGERVTLVKQGQTIEAMAQRLTSLKVSQTVADSFSAQYQDALRATEGATAQLAAAQSGLTDSQRGAEKLQMQLEVRESIVRQLTSDRQTALEEARKYVEDKTREIATNRQYLDTTGPQRLAELRQEAKLIEQGARFPDASEADRTRALEAVKRDIVRERKNMSTARAELEELVLEQSSGWPKNPGAHRAARIASSLKSAQAGVASAKAELTKAQGQVERWKADHVTATKAHEEQAQRSHEAKQLAEMTKGAHEKDVREHHESMEKLPDDWRELLSGDVVKMDPLARAQSFDRVIGEANQQLTDLKARADVLANNQSLADKTVEEAQAEIARSHETIASAKAKVPGLQKQLSEFNKKLADLRARAEVDITEQTDSLDRVKAEAGSETGAIARLERQLQRSKDGYEKERYRYATEVRGLEAEIRRSNAAADRATHKIAELEHGAKQAEAAKHEARVEVDRVRAQIVQLEKTIETLRTNKQHTVQAEHEQLRRDAAERQARLDTERAERDRAAEAAKAEKDRLAEVERKNAESRAVREAEQRRSLKELAERAEQERLNRERLIKK